MRRKLPLDNNLRRGHFSSIKMIESVVDALKKALKLLLKDNNMTFRTKALLDTETVSDMGADWAFSKRAILTAKDNALVIAGEEIPFASITDSRLRIVPSAYFIPGAILSISTENTTHHFGLSFSKKLVTALPFIEDLEKAPNPPFLWGRRIFNIALAGVLLFSLFWRIWN